jgi:hypothetical protein
MCNSISDINGGCSILTWTDSIGVNAIDLDSGMTDRVLEYMPTVCDILAVMMKSGQGIEAGVAISGMVNSWINTMQ